MSLLLMTDRKLDVHRLSICRLSNYDLYFHVYHKKKSIGFIVQYLRMCNFEALKHELIQNSV